MFEGWHAAAKSVTMLESPKGMTSPGWSSLVSSIRRQVLKDGECVYTGKVKRAHYDGFTHYQVLVSVRQPSYFILSGGQRASKGFCQAQLCDRSRGFPDHHRLSDLLYRLLTPFQQTPLSCPAMQLRLAYYCSGHGQLDTLLTSVTTSHQGLSQDTVTQREYLLSHLLSCPSTRHQSSISFRLHRNTFFHNA